MKFAGKWIELEKIVLSDVIQKDKHDQYLAQFSSERLPLVADGSRCRNPQPNIRQRENSNWRSPLGPSPCCLGNPAEEAEEEF